MVKVIEQGLVDDCRQGRADAASLHALLHDDDFAGLANAPCNGLHVKWLQADQVDHLPPAMNHLTQLVRQVHATRLHQRSEPVCNP